MTVREAVVRDYGIRIFAHGIEYHSDRRRRVPGTGEIIWLSPSGPGSRERGNIRGFTRDSQRRLEFCAANVGNTFRSLLTLTYHAPGDSWDDPDRNGEVARRSKRDLNRFLSCLRRELGAYVWAREFQARGVVHYHVLAEHEISEARVTLAWCRSTGELNDEHALQHAAKVDHPKGQQSVRQYLGRYLGKEKQKLLPAGVERAGRWWGRSRGMPLALLDEAITCDWKSADMDYVAIRVTRGVRAYLSKVLGWKFKGGRFVNWGGALASSAAKVMGGLREFYQGELGAEAEGRAS